MTGERASLVHLRSNLRDLQKKKKKKLGRNPMTTPPGRFDLREHQRDRAPHMDSYPALLKSPMFAGEELNSAQADLPISACHSIVTTT